MSTQAFIDCNKYLDESGPCVSYVEVWEAATLAERQRCAKVCDDYATDRYALYRGRPPYTGKEAERYTPHVEGMSDGADVCASMIRALPEDTK